MKEVDLQVQSSVQWTMIDVKLLYRGVVSRKNNFKFQISSCNLLKWRYLGVCSFYCFIVNFKIFWAAFNVIIWRIVLGYKSYIAMNHKNSQ